MLQLKKNVSVINLCTIFFITENLSEVATQINNTIRKETESRGTFNQFITPQISK
eukprot:Pgem_evm1s10555